jgi:hypothetical protein
MSAGWGDAWDWAFAEGAAEGSGNLATSGVVNTEVAVEYMLKVGKLFAAGVQYLGVNIGAISLAGPKAGSLLSSTLTDNSLCTGLPVHTADGTWPHISVSA